MRIHSTVFSFVSKCGRGRNILSRVLVEGRLVFRMFTVQLEEMDEAPDDEEPIFGLNAVGMRPDLDCNEVSGISLTSTFNRNPLHSEKTKQMFENTQVVPKWYQEARDKFVNMALLYLFRKATVELKAFHNAGTLAKIGVEVDGVILSKGRIMKGMEFLETAELDLNLGAMGLRTHLPVLDR